MLAKRCWGLLAYSVLLFGGVLGGALLFGRIGEQRRAENEMSDNHITVDHVRRTTDKPFEEAGKEEAKLRAMWLACGVAPPRDDDGNLLDPEDLPDALFRGEGATDLGSAPAPGQPDREVPAVAAPEAPRSPARISCTSA